MKKMIVFSIAVLIFITATKAQIDTGYKHQGLDANLLLQKSKKQQTLAWILLGGGVVLTGTSFLIAANEFWTPSKTNALPFLFSAGCVSILSSIPFFISSGANKKKANLFLKKQSSGFLQDKLFKNQLSIGLNIKL